jgi:hypothetical protein
VASNEDGRLLAYERRQIPSRDSGNVDGTLSDHPQANKRLAGAAGHNELSATFGLKTGQDSINRFDLMRAVKL